MKTAIAASAPASTAGRALRDPLARQRLSWALVALVVLWPVLVVSEFAPQRFFDPGTASVMAGFLGGFLPPDFSPGFLALLVPAMLDTVAMATAGMALAFVLAAPLSLLVTRALSVSRIGLRRPSPAAQLLRSAARLLMIGLRGVPEIVWALVFVRVLGLGPAAGVLALGLTYGGMLGKVYAEILDSADARPVRALLEGGSGRAAAFAYGLLPVASGELVSYSVYRWECAVRASVVMGFVGAGGLGQLMDQSMKMLNGGEACTILLAFVLLVGLADAVSAGLRAWLARS